MALKERNERSEDANREGLFQFVCPPGLEDKARELIAGSGLGVVIDTESPVTAYGLHADGRTETFIGSQFVGLTRRSTVEKLAELLSEHGIAGDKPVNRVYFFPADEIKGAVEGE